MADDLLRQPGPPDVTNGPSLKRPPIDLTSLPVTLNGGKGCKGIIAYPTDPDMPMLADVTWVDNEDQDGVPILPPPDPIIIKTIRAVTNISSMWYDR